MARFICFLSMLLVVGFPVLLKGGTQEHPEAGDVIDEIENITDQPLTISDLYTYSGQYCTGTKTTIMAKGDPTDDITIAPGGTKIFYLGKCQSVTYSYMWNGKEVEFDDTWDYNLSDQTNAQFGSDFAGLFAIDYSGAGVGPLPPKGEMQLIGGGTGRIASGLYDWITFYNVTASDGMIERDPLGNPLSPVLPDGTLVFLIAGYNVKIFKVTGHETLKADINGDNFVNLLDLAIMAEQWLTGDGTP